MWCGVVCVSVSVVAVVVTCVVRACVASPPPRSACGSTAALLDRTLALATEMFDAGAFLHQYALYGLSRDGFLPAFAALEQLLRLYRDL